MALKTEAPFAAPIVDSLSVRVVVDSVYDQRQTMPDRLIDWNTGSRFSFGV